VNVGAHVGRDLDHRLHHLGLQLIAQRLVQDGDQLVDVGPELPLLVDDLELFLDPDGQPVIAHAAPSTM
jgi:hypothetical protein